MENTNGDCQGLCATHYSEDQFSEYEYSLETHRDLKSIMDTAREEGRLEEKLAIARLMKKEGLAVGDISKFTGLTSEEINKV